MSRNDAFGIEPQQSSSGGGGGVVTLNGDVTGPSNTNTVVKLQNRNLSSAAPSPIFDAIMWNQTGNQWQPKDPYVTEMGVGSYNYIIGHPVDGTGMRKARQHLFADNSYLFTINALWNSATSLWEKDDSTATAYGFHIDEIGQLHLYKTDEGTTSWPFTGWTFDTILDQTGTIISPGTIAAYFGIQTYTNAAMNIGTGVSFGKNFPTTPSSFTISITTSSNINTGTANFWDPQPFGCGVYATTTGAGNAYIYGYIVVS